MTHIEELLAAERNIAIESCVADTGARLMELCITNMASKGAGFGLAAAVSFQGEELTAICGKWGPTALALAMAGKPEEGFNGVSIPLGDGAQPLGSLNLIFPDNVELCSASQESLERIGFLLSSHLRRIENQQRLQRELDEKEKAARLLRHRMRNSLQFFQNMLYLITREGEERKNPVSRRELEDRIATLIAFHEALGNAARDGMIASETWFWILCCQLRKVYAQSGVVLESAYNSEENPSIPVDQATTIGLLAHELVMRSRIASERQPLRLSLRISIERGHLALDYEDDRMESRFGGKRGELAGLLMRSLLSRAHGSLAGNGTSGRFEACFTLTQ